MRESTRAPSTGVPKMVAVIGESGPKRSRFARNCGARPTTGKYSLRVHPEKVQPKSTHAEACLPVLFKLVAKQ